jgi:hypothetical protein
MLTDIETWPQWNPDVRAATITGDLAEETTFQWKAGPSTIRSTLRTVQPMHTLAWTGRTLGIPATHVYRFEPWNGVTRVTTEESWDGVLARLFRSPFQRTLRTALDNGLHALKHEAERRTTNHVDVEQHKHAPYA